MQKNCFFHKYFEISFKGAEMFVLRGEYYNRGYSRRLFLFRFRFSSTSIEPVHCGDVSMKPIWLNLKEVVFAQCYSNFRA